jgi:ABC-type nitrate/sulfonate/bicarbonate transport system substrate-binding protein
MKEATDWGAKNQARVAEILQKAANMKPDDAAAYAGLWRATYVTSMEPADVAMLKRMAEIFRNAGAIKGIAPDSAFDTAPYTRAKARFGK